MSIRLGTLIFVIVLTGCQFTGGTDGKAVTKSVVTQQRPPVHEVQQTSPAPSRALQTSPVVLKDQDSGPDFHKRCITISSPPNNLKIEGTIVFLENHGQSMVLMGEHEGRIPANYRDTNDNNYRQTVSPDRRNLLYRQSAYKPAQTSRLVIVTSDGSIINQFSEDQYKWLPGIDWLSDEYIRYPIQNKEDNEQLDLFALQIQTREMRPLRTSFPDMADGSLIDWEIDTWAINGGVKKGVNVMYDPSLKLAVYPKLLNDYPEKGQHAYLVSLYDVQDSVELAAIQLPGTIRPAWSPDGQYFTIIGEDPVTYSSDIYLISRSGAAFVPLTNLAKQFPRNSFGTYSWSVDSRYIAFWFKEVEQEGGANDFTLMIFDLAAREITDLCIKGNSVSAPLGYKSSFDLRGKPFWSPDGEMLLITQYDPKTQNAIDLLIDLKNGTAYPIATNLEPAGWMQ